MSHLGLLMFRSSHGHYHLCLIASWVRLKSWVRGYMVVFVVKPLQANLWYWVKTKLTWLEWVCACCCNANGLYLLELVLIWYVSVFVWVTQWRRVYFFKRAAKSAGGLVKLVLYTTNFYLYLVQACMLLLLLLLFFGGIHSTFSVKKNITSDQNGKKFCPRMLQLMILSVGCQV